MRSTGARRVGVERVDRYARAEYGRRRDRRAAMLFKPAPKPKWCCRCGWRIGPGEAYRQYGPKRRVPGLDAKSDYTCGWCPWSGPLDAQAILNSLTPGAMHLAQLWAAYVDQRRVDLQKGWRITSAHDDIEFRDWWDGIELLVARKVLRVPAKTNLCAMPPVYVDILMRG